MRTLRTALLAIGFVSLVACGGKDKGAEEPAADPAMEPAPIEGEGEMGDPMENPCAAGEENPCGASEYPEE